jgi:hypothetical protein
MLVWCMPAIVYCWNKYVCMIYSHLYVLFKMFWYYVGLSLYHYQKAYMQSATKMSRQKSGVSSR